jgi:hypothetical protein
MLMTLKFNRQQIADFQNICSMMFQLNMEQVDHICFYNYGTMMQKIQKMNFRSTFSDAKKFVLKLSPNECDNLLTIILWSDELLQKTPYYQAMMIQISMDIQNHQQKSSSLMDGKINNLIHAN